MNGSLMFLFSGDFCFKTGLLSNDPGKKGRIFFCYVAIRFPHIEMLSFSHRKWQFTK